MNTSKLAKEINEIGKELINNYDDEVIAYNVGVKVCEISQNDEINLENLKELAEELFDSYDDEVVAYQSGIKIMEIINES